MLAVALLAPGRAVAEPAEPERPVLDRGPGHVRHDRDRLLRRPTGTGSAGSATTRALPDGRPRLLHRPRLLVPVDALPVHARGGARRCRTAPASAVPLVNRQKIAYAVWAYGRTTNPNRQAAVMLYVHSLMGDARPGEVDPQCDRTRRWRRSSSTVAADAARFHGPVPDRGRVGGKLDGRRAGRRHRPGPLGRGRRGAERDADPVARRAPPACRRRSRPTPGARARRLPPHRGTSVVDRRHGRRAAATLPAVYRPTSQRRAGTRSGWSRPPRRRWPGPSRRHVARGHIAVSTAAAPTRAHRRPRRPRSASTITGATAVWHADVSVTIHGPFASEAETSCGRKAWQGTFEGDGPGHLHHPERHGATPGLVRLPARRARATARTSASGRAATTQPSASSSRRSRRSRRLVSSDSVAPGTPIYDQRDGRQPRRARP